LRTEAGLDVTGLFALLRRAHEPVSNAAVSDEAVY
jgi:hypothetical protein